MAYKYRLLNVFAESSLAGNALCVFEDARGMSDELMQALALQFNLSETTFLLPSQQATARVRIFSPMTEFPFAGHPTLGSAAVVRDHHEAAEHITLEMKAGIIPVACRGEVFTLKANAPRWKRVEASANELGQLVSLPASAIAESPVWMDTGFEQLLIPLRSAEALRDAAINPALAARYANEQGQIKIYLWAGENPVHARFFFTRGPGMIGEDPGTGSACANLGGWMIATGQALPLYLTVHQGDHLGRPCRLHLTVDAEQNIFVGGRVVEIGRGEVHL
ncbi:MAG: PhzF family phenazine biosynthesis protein [Burkholderiales bacterium]